MEAVQAREWIERNLGDRSPTAAQGAEVESLIDSYVQESLAACTSDDDDVFIDLPAIRRTDAGRSILGMSAEEGEACLLAVFARMATRRAVSGYGSETDVERPNIAYCSLRNLYHELLDAADCLRPGVLGSLVLLLAVLPKYEYEFDDHLDDILDLVEIRALKKGLASSLELPIVSLKTASEEVLDPDDCFDQARLERIDRLAARARLAKPVRRYPLDVEATVRTFVASARSRSSHETAKPETLSPGKSILDQTVEQRTQYLVPAMRELALLRVSRGNRIRFGSIEAEQKYLVALITTLLRGKPRIAPDELAECLDLMVVAWFAMPCGAILRYVEQFVAREGMSAALRVPLTELRESLQEERPVQAIRKILLRVESLLRAEQSGLDLARSPWRDQVDAWFSGLDAKAQEDWTGIFALAGQADGKSRPTLKWSNEAGQLVQAVGREAFANQLIQWLDALPLDPERPEANGEVLKGLIWCAGGLEGESMAGPLGRFTERCFKKVPDFGARSVKLGNAGLHALGAIPEAGGVAELSRLSGKVRYPSARKQIEKILLAAAERAGKTIDELEEIAVPDFGLDGTGCRSEALGEFEGVIRIAGSAQVELIWLGPDGKSRKTVPAAVKRDHPEELKQLKQQVKEIKDNLAGQGGRLERLLLAGRRWPLADWRMLYLEHPLLAGLCRRLIWRFEDGGRRASGIAEGDGITDQSGAALDWLGEDTEVALWHPIDEAANRVLAWRNRLAELEITQPFKQAHREIYVLTDAERQTGTYSNRFAAHILRQHQFKALCQQRGWRYELQGQWDSHNIPERELESHGLRVQFYVDPAGEDDISPAYIYLHLASDQVRFYRNGANEPLPLTEVPPLVFSEMMRDVDLFVGVASVAADPTWVDGGPEGRYRDYWWGYSFGELGESAKTRRAVLETLLPKLKIAGRCALADRFLTVRGSKRTYKIHLGSGNILMEPNDQYLCIVKGYDKAAGKQKIRLPFEGDGVLSMILSKAFLLAADDKITDRTILSQIKR